MRIWRKMVHHVLGTELLRLPGGRGIVVDIELRRIGLLLILMRGRRSTTTT